MAHRFSSAVEAARQTIQEDLESEWRLVKKSSGITLSCRSIPDVGVKRYKVEAIINAPPTVVTQYTTPGPNSLRLQWDEHVKDMEILEHLDDTTVLLRTVSHKAAKGLVASREFVDVTVQEINKDGEHVSIGCSVDYPLPVTSAGSSIVRAWNYPAAIFCHPVDGHDDRTKFVSVLQSDLRGKLPTKLVETVIPTVQQHLIMNLKKAIHDKLADRCNSSSSKHSKSLST